MMRILVKVAVAVIALLFSVVSFSGVDSSLMTKSVTEEKEIIPTDTAGFEADFYEYGEEDPLFPPADAGIDYSFIDEATVETEVETIPPAPVEENSNYPFTAPVLTGAAKVDDGVEITWEKIPGAEMYRVFRRSVGEDWENIGDTEESSFVDVMADMGMEYYYTVGCVSTDGTENTSGCSREGIRIVVE